MSRFSEVRHLTYSEEQLFGLVADIERYPEFLPWCVGARIRTQTEERVIADLMIGFKAFRERFTSAVTMHPPHEIDVEFTEGPFTYLKTHWRFTPDPQGCQLEVLVDFEFKNAVYRAIIGSVFDKAATKMIAAFEGRAHKLFGPSPLATLAHG